MIQQQTSSDPDLQREMEDERAEEAEIAKRHFFRRPAPWWYVGKRRSVYQGHRLTRVFKDMVFGFSGGCCCSSYAGSSS